MVPLKDKWIIKPFHNVLKEKSQTSFFAMHYPLLFILALLLCSWKVNWTSLGKHAILLLWSWEFSPWLHFFSQRGWLLKQDNFYYFETETEKEAKQEIPAYKMIQHMLEYAKELERIVWQLRYLVLQVLPCTLGYLFVRNLWLCLSLCSKYIISEERNMVDTLFRFSHPVPAMSLSSYFGWIMNPGRILPAACMIH